MVDDTMTGRLVAAHEAGWLTFDGTTEHGHGYAIWLGSVWREYPAAQMAAWLDGHTAGRAGPARWRPTGPRRRAEIAAVRRLLVDPSFADAVRVQIWLAMQRSGWSLRQLASHAGRDRNAVREAMRFCKPGAALSVPMMESLLDAVGGAVVHYQPGDGTGPAWSPVEVPRAEPVVVSRARALAYCHEAGLIRWVAPLQPGRLALAREFSVRVGAARRTYRLAAADVVPWLVGLADAVDKSVAEALIPSELAGR